MDALVGMLERFAARSSIFDDTVRSLERRVDALEPVLAEARASLNRKETQLAEMSASRTSLANVAGAWMQAQPSCSRIAPTEGIVAHLIEDASKHTVLVLAYAGSIQADPPVRTFCDDESTYIMPPCFDRNTYETLTVACGGTVVELQYRVIPYISEVIAALTSDGACFVTLVGRNLFPHNSLLEVRCSNPTNDVWSIADVSADTSDGTRLSARFDIDPLALLTEWSFTCQLIHPADVRLASNRAQMLLRFESNLSPSS